jgi:hypothetical protein
VIQITYFLIKKIQVLPVVQNWPDCENPTGQMHSTFCVEPILEHARLPGQWWLAHGSVGRSVI